VIHAGLECGILGASHPGMDIVSFGPPSAAPTPRASGRDASVDKAWQLLRAILTDIATG
jgi:dipeptidase D